MNEEQRDELATGKPTTAGEALHGEHANPEVYPQPDVIALSGDTLITDSTQDDSREDRPKS